MVSDLELDERAEVDYVLALRRHWARDLYPRIREAVGEETADEDVADHVHAQEVYPWFAWMERGAQKMSWRTMTRIVRHHGTTVPASPPEPVGRLELRPDVEMPDYYVDNDIHVQPGGLRAGDESALVYELGAKIVMMGDNDDYAFHDLFTRTAVPDGDYGRIVDLGCGFGKSTRPFKSAYPDAEVIGVDLSESVLRLAHAQAEERGLAITFRQADVVDTGLEDASVDLVTATMLIHELPEAEQARLLREASRLLRPGGRLRILDFHLTGDPVRDLAMREHGVRNNEPFMPVLFDHDVLTVCRDAGLENAGWVAFDERGSGRLENLEWPPRPEWHFPWAVLEAEKPTAEPTSEG